MYPGFTDFHILYKIWYILGQRNLELCGSIVQAMLIPKNNLI